MDYLTFNQFSKLSANKTIYILCGSVYVKTTKSNLVKSNKGLTKQNEKGIYHIKPCKQMDAIILLDSITY